MTEPFVTYFGYGSLVNRDTRPANEQAYRARLYGWKRVWGHRVHTTDSSLSGPLGSCCSLSLEKNLKKGVEKCVETPDINSNQLVSSTASSDIARTNNYIDGVIVTIPLADLPSLDRREYGYDRVQISADDFDLPQSCAAQHIHVYVSDRSHSGRSNTQYPILQSYIDCVLAGYCAVFELTGMQQFVESTLGWDGVIENERNNPRYPRAVQLPDSQLALFDSIITKYRSN